MTFHWIIFGFMFLFVLFAFIYFKVKFIDKQAQTEDRKKKENLVTTKYILLFWLYDLLYMAIFNQWLVLEYVFGCLAIIIIFTNLIRALLGENKILHRFLSFDLMLGVVLCVYMIYIIPNEILRNIVSVIVAAILGGLFTLVGVAWTIKNNAKERREELQRIENERKEEERKKLVPYFRLTKPEEASGSISIHMNFNSDIFNDENLKKIKDKYFYCYQIDDFTIKNISKDCVVCECIVVDGIEYPCDGDVLVESGRAIRVKTTRNLSINALDMLQMIQFKCKDLVGNIYTLDCELKSGPSNNILAIVTECEGVEYTGWNIKYSVDKIGLPKIDKR